MFTILFYIILSIFAVVIFTAVAFIFIPRFNKFSDFIFRNIYLFFIAMGIIGFLLYYFGYENEVSNNFFVIAPRAIVSTLKFFVLSSDLSQVNKKYSADYYYILAFSFTFLTAVLLTSIIVLKLIGMRLIAISRLWWYRIWGNKKNVNVFWGMTSPGKSIADDLYSPAHIKDNEVIFVIPTDPENAGKIKKIGLEGLMNFDFFRQDELEYLAERGFLFSTASGNISEAKNEGIDIFALLDIRLIGRILLKSRNVRLYFLSTDEDANIRNASAFLKSDSLRKMKSVEIYIRADKENNETLEYYEYYSALKNVTVRVLDSAFLSVASLKMKPEYHPVNYIDINKETSVCESPFNAMIIGFGATGKKVFDFLYEFSALLGKDDKKNEADFYVYDKDMKNILPSFFVRRPALKEDKELHFIDCNISSSEFWNSVESIIGRVNYVVISIDDDVKGALLALEIYRLACKERKNNLRKFDIFLHCTREENLPRIREMLKSHNENNRQNDGGEIIIFGGEDAIYSYDVVINDKLRREAKEFYKTYFEVENPDMKADADNLWEKNYGKDAVEKRIPKYGSKLFAIRSMKREISQNFSNCMHKYTKEKLLGMDDREERESIIGVAYSRKDKTLEYSEADSRLQEKLLNLGKTEHLRWVVSHILLGYVKGEKKDEVTMTHPCICSWEELEDDVVRSYDCNVVDTSIKLLATENKNNGK